MLWGPFAHFWQLEHESQRELDRLTWENTALNWTLKSEPPLNIYHIRPFSNIKLLIQGCFANKS